MGAGMTEPGCRSWREELTDVALGRQAIGDLPGFQAHIDGCGACRAELSELGSIAAALADAEIGADVPVIPRDLGARVNERVQIEHRRRRQRRWFAGTAAAAAAVLVAIGLTIALTSTSDPDPVAAEPDLEVVLDGETASGSAGFVVKGWGTEIFLVAEGLTAGDPYQAWLSSEEGDRVSAGTFLMVDGGRLNIRLASALQLDDARWIWVTDADDETVLAAAL